VQPELAATLERIAQSGARDFYEGVTAQQFVKAVREAGGIVTARDLHDYAPVWRAPIQIHFGDTEIYTMAPPAAGGLVLAETLNILSGYDLREEGFQTPRALHLIAEATRRAYIDRNKYLGDPSTTRIPYRELVSAERAALWRSSIDLARATPTATLAEPNAPAIESNHTTHISIADAAGNVVSLTTTLNDDFGSGFVIPGLGFFLNDEMDDFTPAPGRPNRYGLVQGIANTIEPSKRMASSMSPVIVLKNGRPYLALGTRGGPAIPTSVLQVLLAVLVYGKSLEEAVAAPRYHHQATPDQIAYELGRAPQSSVDALNAMGHPVVPRKAIGDVHALQFEKGIIIAVADPRNGGAAGGF
jgi:gamma-glutamyltranspeptidase/glutathione hydrolase